MVYLVSHETSTFGMLEYGSNNRLTYDDFWKGYRIRFNDEPLHYSLRKRSRISNLMSRHLIESTYAPLLVSDDFRKTVESNSPDDAEFLPALIQAGDQRITRFWAINVLNRAKCINMEKSEFRQTNFDSDQPQYLFSYTVMNDIWDTTASIAICEEQDNQFAVNESIKSAFKKNSLKGLIFFSELDMSYANRTVCERIR